MSLRNTVIYMILAVVIALIALLPLRLVLAASGSGLAARSATGSVWFGRLADAQWRGAGLGDVAIRLAPLPLLTGQLRLAFDGATLRGTLQPHGVTGLTGQVAMAGTTPLPISSVTFDDVDMIFSNRACERARGTMRVMAGGALALPGVLAAGGAMAAPFAGMPRCDGGKLVLPLVSGPARMDLRIAADGRYTAAITIDNVEESARPGLLAAGFQPTPQGAALTLEGSL
jgi:general secretion pathway protein N